MTVLRTWLNPANLTPCNGTMTAMKNRIETKTSSANGYALALFQCPGLI